ncbi:unnamed protein product [Auanema sp. JU1783]|nr:unnamed protein product [Auanema sp. JU1783]
MSTFARSDAVHIPGYMPRKQNSTPNPPTTHRIYDRSHVYSRSWNPECSSPPTHSSQQSAHFSYHYNRPDEFQYNTPTDRYPSRSSYEAAQADQYSSDACYENPEQIYPQTLFIPTINEPVQANSLSVRQFQRQAKSFDDRPRAPDGRRPSMADRRTVSVTEPRNQFVRQSTVQQHTGDESPVTKACHSLWAAKGHLEQLHALGISDPSSASTSFDSNTDSQSVAMEPKPKQEENADRKRMKYKSLLIQRKFLSTTAVSSMDSTNSTESSAHDPLFTSSVDSLKSDLEQRRLSLMTRHSNVSSPHIGGSSRLERDYSVDTKSDNLFREWSRVDPAYAARDHREFTPPVAAPTPIRLQRGSTQDPYSQPQRDRMYGRQMTIAGSSHVVPFICYPDEQNCSR